MAFSGFTFDHKWNQNIWSSFVSKLQDTFTQVLTAFTHTKGSFSGGAAMDGGGVNFASVARTGAGIFVVTYSKAVLAGYVILASTEDAGNLAFVITTHTVNGFTMMVRTADTGVPTDPVRVFFAIL